MNQEIKVFGQTAKTINEGDIFVPVFDSVEGRDVVTLVKNNSMKKVLDLYDENAIGLDQLIAEIRHLVAENRITA